MYQSFKVMFRKSIELKLSLLIFERIVSKNTKLTRAHFRIMICYDFKKCLTTLECKESSGSVFGEHAPSLATIYRWYKVFE